MRTTDEALVEAFAALPPAVREQVAREAAGMAERSEAEVEHLPFVAVWRAVVGLVGDVSAVAGDPLAAALLEVLASSCTVAAAVARCPEGLRRVLAVTCARQRDHDVVDGRLSASWWAALAALVSEVDSGERAALRAAEDDVHGVSAATLTVGDDAAL